MQFLGQLDMKVMIAEKTWVGENGMQFMGKLDMKVSIAEKAWVSLSLLFLFYIYAIYT